MPNNSTMSASFICLTYRYFILQQKRHLFYIITFANTWIVTYNVFKYNNIFHGTTKYLIWWYHRTCKIIIMVILTERKWEKMILKRCLFEDEPKRQKTSFKIIWFNFLIQILSRDKMSYDVLGLYLWTLKDIIEWLKRGMECNR